MLVVNNGRLLSSASHDSDVMEMMMLYRECQSKILLDPATPRAHVLLKSDWCGRTDEASCK